MEIAFAAISVPPGVMPSCTATPVAAVASPPPVPAAPAGVSGAVKKASNSSLCVLHSSVIATLRSASPIAIGRSLPLGLRSATSFAELSSTRASPATSPLSSASKTCLSVPA